MLIAAAVCPHPPPLIPAAIGAAAADRPPELSAVGDACQVAVHALAAADDHWLGRLDPELDDELLVAARAAWQVLAGAADGTRLQGRLLCLANPCGVSYLVASWAEP